MRFVKKLNERGVVTLPADIREALDLADGDIVEFEVLRVVRRCERNDEESTRTVISETPKSPGNPVGTHGVSS